MVYPLSVPRITLSQRTRQHLFALFRDPQFSKTKLADYCHKPASWLSNFLHPGPRSKNPSFHMDELDDIAGYFKMSVGELLGVAKPGELTGDEQRMVYAFRVLSPAVREHFLALLELASLAPQQTLRSQPQARIKDSLRQQPQPDGPHGDLVPGDPATELRELRRYLTTALAALASAAAGAIPDRPAPGVGDDQARRRGMAHELRRPVP